MSIWPSIIEQIESATQQKFTLIKAQPLAGGDINRAVHLQGKTHSYFVKLNRADLLAMFIAEALGLQELANTRLLRIPEVIVWGTVGAQAFLVLEYLHLQPLKSSARRALGQQLALLHQLPQAYFGWQQDNFIGSNVQQNTRQTAWLPFWQQQRLQFQLQLAAQRGYQGQLQALGALVCRQLPAFFSAYQPAASLLHGDLWSGNAAADELGQPTIYDPACYYGDREADIAMTELFGGFGADFYAAYNDVWPLDPGYQTRKQLYNLYHILNHINLFGGGYVAQAENMMRQLLAQLR